MTIASRTDRARPTPSTATPPAWLFPGKIGLAITVNWRQAAVDVMVHDLKLARELEQVKDSIHIARLRMLSTRCELALARCRTV
jgi:hypothetical protein